MDGGSGRLQQVYRNRSPALLQPGSAPPEGLDRGTWERFLGFVSQRLELDAQVGGWVRPVRWSNGACC